MATLAEYTRKRNFKVTSEPAGRKPAKSKGKGLIFVVQEHHASHLHYDFRLEWDGVLKSWAVPKGPSLDPSQRRLAVEVEDHPKEYAKFTGTIPANQYGAGEVYRWDIGTWTPKNDFAAGLRKGRLEFELKGGKLKGEFLLVRTRSQGSKPNWLLIKRHDKYAVEGDKLEAVAPSEARAKTSKKISAKVGAALKKKPSGQLEFIPPQLAQLVTKPPKGEDWVHEIKFDGYRIQAHIQNKKVKLFTRNGLDWTEKYPSLEKAFKKLKVDDAILDGEIVWQDEEGRSSFQHLQNAMKARRTDSLLFWAFDLLELNGEDLRSLPLIARKTRLEKIVQSAKRDQLRYSEHYRGMGEQLIKASCGMNLEGIVSKRVDRPYTSGRRDDWVKSKCIKRQEFVIGGYSDPEGSRVGFGSLLLGVFEGKQLRYVGRVGTGFDHGLLRSIYGKMKKLEQEEPAFTLNTPKGRDIHWLKPQLVCEVSFAEWTHGKHLRAPVFIALRGDKPARQITIETPKAVKGGKVKSTTAKSEEIDDFHVTHPERVIFEKEKITKGEVAEYYQRVSRWILPHISDRPLSLVRCPQSSTKTCFFSKHFTQKLPEEIIEIPEKGNEPWVAVNSERGLHSLIQWGTLEIHPWNSHRQTIETPDQIVMDFDPDTKIDFEQVKEAALELKDLLDQLGLRSFIKTTGGKGLHVQFPFEPLYDWDTVKSFSKTLVQEMVSRKPDLYTGNLSKKARGGKIFIDYLRNGRGSTAIAPYSLRAREISSVAMPITWKDLDKLKGGNVFTLKKALDHLSRRRSDPWKDYFSTKQKISLLS